jgi:hypothetical protein
MVKLTAIDVIGIPWLRFPRESANNAFGLMPQPESCSGNRSLLREFPGYVSNPQNHNTALLFVRSKRDAQDGNTVILREFHAMGRCAVGTLSRLDRVGVSTQSS